MTDFGVLASSRCGEGGKEGARVGQSAQKWAELASSMHGCVIDPRSSPLFPRYALAETSARSWTTGAHGQLYPSRSAEAFARGRIQTGLIAVPAVVKSSVHEHERRPI